MAELSIPETITIKEAVDLTGASRSTLERAVRTADITAFKPGATVQLVLKGSSLPLP